MLGGCSSLPELNAPCMGGSEITRDLTIEHRLCGSPLISATFYADELQVGDYLIWTGTDFEKINTTINGQDYKIEYQENINQSTMKNLYQYAILEEVEFSNEDSSEVSKETNVVKEITSITANSEKEVRNKAIKNDLSNEQIEKLEEGTVKIIVVPFG